MGAEKEDNLWKGGGRGEIEGKEDGEDRSEQSSKANAYERAREGRGRGGDFGVKCFFFSFWRFQ